MCDGKKKVKKISCSGLSGIESKCESACNAAPQCDDRLAESSLPDECTSSKLEVIGIVTQPVNIHQPSTSVTQAIVVKVDLVETKLITAFMIMNGNGQQANQLVFAVAMLIVLVMIQILI